VIALHDAAKISAALAEVSETSTASGPSLGAQRRCGSVERRGAVPSAPRARIHRARRAGEQLGDDGGEGARFAAGVAGSQVETTRGGPVALELGAQPARGGQRRSGSKVSRKHVALELPTFANGGYSSLCAEFEAARLAERIAEVAADELAIGKFATARTSIGGRRRA
jgi:hypothetical protein